MVEIDWNIGRIFDTPIDLGLEENTLVIFTSDNGPWLNYGNYVGNSGRLLEGKGTSFEGGLRVPCLMVWKGAITPETINNNLISGIDILPTITEVANAPLLERRLME